MVSGKVHTKRYLRSAAAEPIVASGHTSTVRNVLVRRSYRVTMPPTLPKPEALDQMMLGSCGSGVAQPLSPPPIEDHSPRGIAGMSGGAPNLLLLGPRVDGPSWRLP